MPAYFRKKHNRPCPQSWNKTWMNDIQNALEEYCEIHFQWITQKLPKDVNTLKISEMRGK